MAIEIPDGWPGRTWVEDTPLGHLETIESEAATGVDPTRWKLASWETTREISSSSLPGQVRAKTGLSVGTGKALVKRDGNDFPWKKRAVYNLSGSDAQVLLAPENRSEIPTGQFRVAETSGDITTYGVQVDLDEKTIEGGESSPGVLGEQFVSTQQIDDIVFDPAWLVEQLAQQMGYGVGVRPGEALPDGSTYRPVLDVPFQGSMVPEFPRGIEFTEYAGEEVAWGKLPGEEGIIGLTSRPENSSAHVEYRLNNPIPETAIYTMDVRGWLIVQWRSAVGPGRLEFEIESYADSTDMDFYIYSIGNNGTNNPLAAETYTFPISNERPSGVQVQLETTTTGAVLTSARARVRRGPGSVWSAWLNHAMPNTMTAEEAYALHAIIGGPEDTGVLSRLSVVDTTAAPLDPDVLLYGNTSGPSGRIYLEPLLGISSSPWLDPDGTVWGTMQKIVEAWQGALITDVYGDLHLLNRHTLTGVGSGVEAVLDVGTNFEDLPWVMDYADQADRLVFKYRPAVERRADGGTVSSLPIVWEASEIIIAYPGANEVFFTLDYIYPVDLQLLQFARKDNPESVARHSWDAYRYNNGTGAHIDANEDIGLRIDRVTSSTWRIYIENRTASPFHMVDNTGAPWLKIRSSFWFDQTVEQTIERGASATDARNEITIDVSNYVQNAADANELADFIWGRVNRRSWRVSTVNTIPDYSLDLGDVREMVHSRTGVRNNVLVSKVHLAGKPGEVTQKLDLVLIPPTWEDFDEAWATKPGGNTWAAFNALWDDYTWADFNRTPTATTVAEIEEAM